MGVEPWPVVNFDGVGQSCLVIDLFTDPVVCDGLEITWGRTEYMSHAGVATLNVEWIDRTGQLAARIREKRMLGSPIAVQYADGQGWGAAMFQGRITGCTARPDIPDPYATDPEAKCWRVSVQAADKTQTCADIIQPPGWTWPQETMQARAVALRNASFIAGISEYYFYPHHVNSIAWPLEVKGKDNLSLIREFYMSMGDTFSYLPDENVVRYLHRRAYDVWANWVQSADGIVRMSANDHYFDTRTYRGTSFQGCDVTSEEFAGIPIQSAITRVEASWKDTKNNATDVTTVVWADEQSELDRGRRALSFTTWLGDGVQVDPVCLEVLNRGRFEGSQPKHPAITRDTRRTKGFYNRSEARALLMGGETQAVVYVSGSQYAMWMFQVPFYAILGGTIRWEHPGWIITNELQFHLATNTITPLRWNQVTATLYWTQPPTIGSLCESMTWFDAAFLQTGNVFVPTEP